MNRQKLPTYILFWTLVSSTMTSPYIAETVRLGRVIRMRQRLPTHKQMIRARRPIIISQDPRIRHPIPKSIRQRIIPNLRNCIPVSRNPPNHEGK